MKKKILTLCLLSIMALNVVACGNESTNNSTNTNNLIIENTENKDETTKVVSENTESSEAIESEIIDLNTLSKDEQKKVVASHTKIIIEAIKNLDSETLKTYLKEEDFEDVNEAITKIKSNPEDVEFWNNTIGTMIYFEDSDVLLYKSIEYTKAAWYTDCWKNNEELPAEDSEDFSNEYLNKIYENYYVNAPYEGTYQASKSLHVSISEEGKITFWPYGSANSEIESMVECIRSSNENIRSSILLDNADCFGLGYDYIKSDDQIPHFELFLDKNIDGIMEKSLEMNLIDLEARQDSVAHAFKTYFEDENNKTIIQNYFNEECTVLRDLSTIQIFTPANIDKTFPFDTITSNDKETLTNMNIKIVDNITILNFNEDSSSFMFFCDLSDSAIENNLVENISMFKKKN